MPVFDFPVSPAIDDIYTENGVSYIWNGEVWRTGVGVLPTAYVKIAGDTMTGPLVTSGLPATPPQAANKDYVDRLVSTFSLYQGTWQVAANIPDLDPAARPILENGYSWTAQTADPNIPELAPASIPGIGGTLITALDTIKWNESLAVYEHLKGPTSTSTILISDNPPPNPLHGTLWWDSDSGKHYVFFDDGTSQQWVQISGGGGSNAVKLIESGDTPPANPFPDMLWFNSTTGYLYCWYDDGTGAQWVDTTSGMVQVEEAPIDGTPYARQDADWLPAALLTGVTIGDVKNGFQTIDHGGWIKLDGRAISTLTANQQAEAVLLGFTTNLPNAGGAVQIMRDGTGNVLGSINGSSAKKITHAMLPAVNLTAANAAVLTTSGSDPAAVTTSGSDPGAVTSSSAGGHGHKSEGHTGGAGISFEHQNMAWNKWATSAAIGNEGAAYTAVKNLVEDVGPHTHTVDMPNHTHTVDMPNHTHTVPAHSHTVALGGSGADFDVTMKHMHVNTFVYLGA